MGMRTLVSRSVLDGIEIISTAAAPREACGLLLGEGACVTAMTQADNVSLTPKTHFEIDPRALFAALRAERSGGPALLGYWHSHPSGEAAPSATDAAMAAPDGKLWLIAGGGRVTAWRAVEKGAVFGRFEAVELMAI